MSTVLESLNQGLHRAFAADGRVLLLGEDVLDPYGGAFKVTQGLSTAYPGRVLTTPISEAGIVGIGTGMALRGLRPVVEIMFGDFVTLIADQMINHAAKFRWMYNDQVRVPMVVRTPMGGRRGYGPTHSQTLEKLYLGIPGLRVLAPAAFGDPGELLCETILQSEDPVLFIENKLLYPISLKDEGWLRKEGVELEGEKSSSSSPSTKQPGTVGMHPPAWAYTLRLRQAPPPKVTLAAYGYMAELALQGMLKLAYEDEIFTELVVLTQLAPCQLDPVQASIQRTGRLLTIEEGTYTLGWGSEVIARMAESGCAPRAIFRRVGALELPVPASPALESRVLPGVEHIVQAVQSMV